MISDWAQFALASALVVVTTRQGEGGEESTGRGQPGYPDDALDVVRHEEEQRQKPDPVADRTNHHPSVSMARALLESATVDSE